MVSPISNNPPPHYHHSVAPEVKKNTGAEQTKPATSNTPVQEVHGHGGGGGGHAGHVTKIQTEDVGTAQRRGFRMMTKSSMLMRQKILKDIGAEGKITKQQPQKEKEKKKKEEKKQ